MTDTTLTENDVKMLHTLPAKIESLEFAICNTQAPPPPAHNDLFAALAIAQGAIVAAEATQENTHFDYKYANLQNCLDACRKPLADNELAVIQLPTVIDGGAVQVQTILGHSSGQSITQTMTMQPEKGGPQAVGSCITYLRRYMLCAMVGIGQQDDDANLATKDPGEYDRITPEQAEAILLAANDLFGDQDDAVIARMLGKVFSTSDVPITQVADIPAGQHEAAITLLKNQHGREQAKANKEKPKPDEKKPAAKPEIKPQAE